MKEEGNLLQRLMEQRAAGLYNNYHIQAKRLSELFSKPIDLAEFMKEEFIRFKMLNPDKPEHEWHYKHWVLKQLGYRWTDEELRKKVKDAVVKYFEELETPQPEPLELMAEVKELREAIEDKPENWRIEEQIVCLHELGIIQALHDKNPSSINAIAKALAPALNRNPKSLQSKLNKYFSQEKQSEILTPERVVKVRKIIDNAHIDSIK